MFEKLRNNLLSHSKIAVGIVAVLLFVLGLIQVAQGFIDTHNYRDEFIRIIQDKTGRKINIKGKVSISLLPTPTIYIPGVELRDNEAKAPIPSITVDMIRLDASFFEIFSEHPKISHITLQQPVLEVERAQDNNIDWDWLNAGLLKALSSVTDTNAPSMDINGGTIIYHDDRTGKDVVAERLRASITSGSHIGAKGSFAMYGHHLEFSFGANGLPVAGGSIPFTAELHADSHNALHWQGNMDLLADVPKISGKFDMALQNVMDWTNAAQVPETKSPLAIITNQFTRKDETPVKESPMPLTLAGDWSQEGINIEINNVTLKGLNSDGTGTLSLGWKDWQPLFTCNMGFTTLDYTRWRTFLTAVFGNQSDINYAADAEHQENPLPKDIQANLMITADLTNTGTQILKNIKLAASLAEATITVDRFSIELPGESSLTLFGVISQGATSGMRFEGNMETSGKSLRQALSVFEPSAANLPESGFGSFYAHSNIFVSAEQVRLSEADVKLSDLALNGGLVVYFDARPRLEADVKLKDINFDYLRDIWRGIQKEMAQGETTPPDAAPTIKTPQQSYKGINLNWLNKLQTSIDFKVNVNGFTFMERKGDSASFRIFAKDGEFGLYDVRLNYPEDSVEGSFNINVKGPQPLINIILVTDTLDLGYFIDIPPEIAPSPAEEKAAAGGKKVWSEAFIDTSWMEGFNGAFDISIGKLMYGKTNINRLKFKAKLDNRLLTFQNFTFDYWKGRCGILGSIYGGEVPGLSVSFILYAVELHDMLKDLIGRDNISGAASISGTLTTSGVNMLSLISQSDGKIVMAGRGVNVTGFNLQGVTDAVAISRTAADVFNNVNLALVNGTTEFSVDGNGNIQNGVIKTPGITLRAGTVIGDLTGDISLVPWTMDLSTLFQFPVITSETVPTMTVELSGPIGAPELKTDTSSLEAYVAKRIISR